MSDRPLPDDPASWPDDPHALLGVPEDVSARELRRAYHRLIRVYKPEQFPEPFRRIREAYEHLLPYAEMFGASDAPADPPAADSPVVLPPPHQEAEEERHPTQKDSAPHEPELAPALSPEEEMEELWERAASGAPAAAYTRLRQPWQDGAGRTEVYLRLYWLLTLWRDLDARRVPQDWLVEGLLATGLAGPLRELYREEVADDPAEALGDRFDRLLDADVPASLLADLAEVRFEAAVRLGRWDVIALDLPRLRRRFGPGEERLWLRLVFGLADGAAWSDATAARDVFETCRGEVTRHEFLAGDLSDAFDRFELLQEASAGWRRLCHGQGVPLWFLQLLASSWHRPFSEVRPRVADLLERVSGEPGPWLGHLDEVRKEGPAVLVLVGRLLDHFEASREAGEVPPADPETLADLVRPRLARWHKAGYPAARPDLLACCLQQAVTPDELAEAAAALGGAWGDLGAAWADEVRADWPLRYVCRAHQLFWA